MFTTGSNFIMGSKRPTSIFKFCPGSRELREQLQTARCCFGTSHKFYHQCSQEMIRNLLHNNEGNQMKPV